MTINTTKKSTTINKSINNKLFLDFSINKQSLQYFYTLYNIIIIKSKIFPNGINKKYGAEIIAVNNEYRFFFSDKSRLLNIKNLQSKNIITDDKNMVETVNNILCKSE